LAEPDVATDGFSLEGRGTIGSGRPIRVVGLIGAAAAVVAVVLRIAAPFDHGSWLIAYLVLVGALAPWLLALGEERLGAAADRRTMPEAAAWLAGLIAVPAGVLADARVLVVVGGIALLAALVSIARRALAVGAAAPALAAHGAVIAFMAASTLVGIGLAWDTPWL
jgi:hypothetical protein